MSAVANRTPMSERQSKFYQDLAMPVSSRRSGGRFSTPGQAAAVSALWSENFANSDLPPPPAFTLEDRFDLSPESGVSDYPTFPELKFDSGTFVKSSGGEFSTTKSKSEVSTSYAGISKQQSRQSPVVNSSWWSSPPTKIGGSSEQYDKDNSSPVKGLVRSGALVLFPPPREVARPEVEKSLVPVGNLDEEEWVTVYGFSLADTYLVLREFEKCGVILKHIPGPRDANWMHILYQNRFDAQKALNKNGMEINGILSIGVKPVDPMKRPMLLNKGFMPLPPHSSTRSSESNGFKVSSTYPYYPQNGASSGSSMATPAKSVVSLITDLMFGV